MDMLPVRAIGLLAVAALTGVGYLSAWWLRHKARRWVAVEGTFVDGDAVQFSQETDAHWFAKMHYSFVTKGGDYYGGEALFKLSNQEAACEFARKRTNTKVTIRYNPRNPDESTIDENSK